MKSSLYKVLLSTLCVFSVVNPQVFASETDYSPYPQPDAGYVTDHADLLNADEELRLERWLFQVEEKTNVEIIVVTIRSLSEYEGTKNNTIEAFATALFDAYGIGNMPNNDGVLFLVSKNDRKARIELGKYYGIDRNSDATRIMQNRIIPQFKSGDFPAGITSGTEGIIEEFAGMRVTFPWYIVGIAIAGLICLVVGISCLRNGKKGWGYVFIGTGIVLFLVAVYLTKQTLKHSKTIGGAGGFGGGFSGGGGATGSW